MIDVEMASAVHNRVLSWNFDVEGLHDCDWGSKLQSSWDSAENCGEARPAKVPSAYDEVLAQSQSSQLCSSFSIGRQQPSVKIWA